MALIQCAECGNQMSDLADNCPKCGWSAAAATAAATPRVPAAGLLQLGPFLAEARMPHLAGLAAFAVMGMVSMLDVEMITNAGRLVGAVGSLYLLVLVCSRAFGLRAASAHQRRVACLDAFEIALYAAVASWTAAFWWGFAIEAVSGANDVKEMLLHNASLLATTSFAAFVLCIAMAAVSVAASEER